MGLKVKGGTLMKLGICNETFKEGERSWPLKRVMEYVSNLDYQGLEIAPFTLASSVGEFVPLPLVGVH